MAKLSQAAATQVRERTTTPVMFQGRELELTTADGSRRYQLCDELGYGGASVVFIGLDRDLDRQVAIKILRRELSESKEAVTRFLNEAQTMAKLHHPGIVPIYEVGLLNGDELFFAMERVQGVTLRQILDAWSKGTGDYTLEGLLRIYEQVCQIVAYAHSVKLAHRDLKPENIMVGGFNTVYVMDWGIAKDFDEARAELPIRGRAGAAGDLSKTFAQNLTAPGGMKGTPTYMSPEQVLGAMQRVDYRSDVFSLGIILYEILAGRHPYRRGDVRETLNAIKREDPPPVRLPFGFRVYGSICGKALQKLPEHRYENAGRLAADMRRALEHRSVSVHRDSLLNHYFKFARRHRAVTIAFLAVAALALGVALVTFRSDRELAQVLEMAQHRMTSAAHYDERLAVLAGRKRTAARVMQREMQLLMDDLRARRDANLTAARSLLTVAWRKAGPSLSAPRRTQLQRLWLEEVDRELRQGNVAGARMVFEELSDDCNDPGWAWTPAQRRRITQLARHLTRVKAGSAGDARAEP